MTVPGPSIGFRDWDRTTHFAGVEKFSFANNIPNQISSGAVYAGDFGYLNVALNLVLAAQNYHMQISWFTDQALTQGVIAQNFVLQAGAQGAMQFPVMTEWCDVFVTNLAGIADAVVGVSVFGTNAPAYSMRTGQAQTPLLFSQDSAFAINQQKVVAATSTTPGPATLYARGSVNTVYHVTLQYLDFVTNTYLTFGDFFGQTLGETFSESISLPAAPIRAVINNGGTAQNIVVAVVSDS